MYIKYKYNDHGHSKDWLILEVPDDLAGCESILEYLCDCTDIFPTWSERFHTDRIKFEKIEPTKEMILEKISILEANVKYKLIKIEELKALL